jgi:hypothetical protein
LQELKKERESRMQLERRKGGRQGGGIQSVVGPVAARSGRQQLEFSARFKKKKKLK